MVSLYRQIYAGTAMNLSIENGSLVLADSEEGFAGSMIAFTSLSR